MGFLVRILLLFVLALLVARAFWRMVAGVIVGASQPASGARRRRPAVPERGVQMVRDPICGTFLPPANALTLVARNGTVTYFCSEACRGRFEERRVASRRS